MDGGPGDGDSSHGGEEVEEEEQEEEEEEELDFERGDVQAFMELLDNEIRHALVRKDFYFIYLFIIYDFDFCSPSSALYHPHIPPESLYFHSTALYSVLFQPHILFRRIWAFRFCSLAAQAPLPQGD